MLRNFKYYKYIDFIKHMTFFIFIINYNKNIHWINLRERCIHYLTVFDPKKVILQK